VRAAAARGAPRKAQQTGTPLMVEEFMGLSLRAFMGRALSKRRASVVLAPPARPQNRRFTHDYNHMNTKGRAVSPPGRDGRTVARLPHLVCPILPRYTRTAPDSRLP